MSRGPGVNYRADAAASANTCPFRALALKMCDGLRLLLGSCRLRRQNHPPDSSNPHTADYTFSVWASFATGPTMLSYQMLQSGRSNGANAAVKSHR